MINKRNLFIGTLVALVFAGSSCEAPDQELFSEIPNEVALGTEDPVALQAFAAGAYKPLVGTWGGHNSLWSLHEVASDEMTITQKGADWEDGGQWIRVHRHEYLPSEQSVNNGWAYCYGAIGTINNLLKNFGSSELLRSELEALRAVVYLWLVDAYGNVPVILETDVNPTPANNTRAEVYDFIEKSILGGTWKGTTFKANIDNLTKTRTYGTMNYWVAQTALAKLYLNAQVYTGTAQWQKAADAANVVINGGIYSLESNFFDNFKTENGGSKENIFVIPYDQNTGTGFNLPQMTLHYASQATYNLQSQPWNGYASLEEFYNSFDATDKRKASFLEGPQFSSSGVRLEDGSAEAADPDGAPLTYTPAINMLYPQSLRQAGVRVGKWQFASGATPDLSNDFPIYRYSDVLLVRAEALWRLSPASAEALSLVNQVRARAGVNALASLTADDLLAERGRELFAEGWRRSDQIRFGKYNQAWWEKPASATTKNLFPIPQAQRLVNPNLTQNPGY